MPTLTIEPLTRDRCIPSRDSSPSPDPGERGAGSAPFMDPSRPPERARLPEGLSLDQVSDAFFRDCGWRLRVDSALLGAQSAGRSLIQLLLTVRDQVAGLQPGEIEPICGGGQDSWMLLEELDDEIWIRVSSAREARLHRADLLEALDETISRVLRPG